MFILDDGYNDFICFPQWKGSKIKVLAAVFEESLHKKLLKKRDSQEFPSPFRVQGNRSRDHRKSEGGKRRNTRLGRENLLQKK